MNKTTNKFSPEFRERAVRMVLDGEKDHPSRWAAVTSIAGKFGCSGYTLLEWVKKSEADKGMRAGVQTELTDKPKALNGPLVRHLHAVRKSWQRPSCHFGAGQ